MNNRRRILMLLENESYPDDRRVALEAECLRDSGYAVRVICPTGQSRRFRENVAGVDVYRYPQPGELGGFLGYVWEYGYSLTMAWLVSVYVLVRHGFDVVHAHAPPDMLVLIGGFYRLLGKRLVVDQHDLSPELYQARSAGHGSRCVCAALRWFERLACRTADYLIATNETQRRTQIERGGADPDRCCVVRNGPDERFLEPIEPLQRLRAEGKAVVGYLGMIGVQDRVDLFLHALAWMKEHLGRTDFRAVIVGTGPALGDLKRLAQELDLPGLVHFAGYRVGDDLLRHLASFDICVTPDPSNPYNDSCTMVKTTEYMALAKPVVAFDLPETRLTAGDAALYARDNCPQDLGRLIARLIDNPREARLLGHRGRQRVRERWTWQRQRLALVGLYDAVFSAAEPASRAASPDGAGVAPAEQPTVAAPGSGTARHELSVSQGH